MGAMVERLRREIPGWHPGACHENKAGVMSIVDNMERTIAHLAALRAAGDGEADALSSTLAWAVEQGYIPAEVLRDPTSRVLIADGLAASLVAWERDSAAWRAEQEQELGRRSEL
jgi:hypothetical protein